MTAVVFAGLSGCVVQPAGLTGRSADRPKKIADAYAAMARDDWADAEVLLGRFLLETPSGPWAYQARYLLGICYLKNLDMMAAEDEFKYVANHATSRELVRQARVRLGDVALASCEYDQAATQFNGLLQRSRHFKDGAELMYKLGYTRLKQGRWEEATAIFKKTRTTYPGTVFATRAMSQLGTPHHFSLQVGAFNSEANAQARLNDLRKKGYTAFVYQASQAHSARYCVRVGTFKTRSEAIEFQSKMQNNPDLRFSIVVP